MGTSTTTVTRASRGGGIANRRSTARARGRRRRARRLGRGTLDPERRRRASVRDLE
jgi:hypothetical protein